MQQRQATSERATHGAWLRKNRSILIQYVGLALVALVFGILSKGRLFSARSMTTLVRQLTTLSILSLGLVFVYAHGGMDISVGAVTALSGLCATLGMNATGGNIWVGMGLSILVSMACYALNVIVSSQFGLMSTISSLAIMFVGRGVVTYVISVHKTKIAVANTAALEIFRSSTPLMIGAMAATAALSILLFNYTRMGKQCRAIGENPLAAARSGVRVFPVKLGAYLYAGLATGIASVFLLARAGSISEKTGSGLEMDVIITLILGGMALNGGARSRISSAIVGSITYVLLNNGLIMAGLDTQIVALVKGALFVVVVFITIRQPSSAKTLPR